MQPKLTDWSVSGVTMCAARAVGKYWMNQETESVGALYIDGHVRVYHGRLTQLPRRYVSRERLCLRGITGYWVNDAVGRPFFVIEKEIDPGTVEHFEARYCSEVA